MLFCIPRHHNKRSYPTATPFPHTPSSTNWIISAIFQIYRRFLHFYRRFFIISTIRHRISTYRQFSAIYLYSIPHHYNKRSYPHSNFFSIYHPVPTGLYQRFFKYIGDFYTFIGDFSLYRRFDIGYRLTDNFRQSIYALYPATTIKEVTLSATSFPYTAQYQPDYINDFSNISIVSPLISTIFHYIGDSTQDIDLTTTFDTRNAQHTLSPSNLLPSSTIKKITNKIASIFNATYATLKTT